MRRSADDVAAEAEITRILAENATLLGEPRVTLDIRRRPKGWVRIVTIDENGRAKVDGWPRDYLGWQRALAAARLANRRAKHAHDLMEQGVQINEAVWKAIKKHPEERP